MPFALVGRNLASYCAHYFVSNLKSWPLGFHRKFPNETHLFLFLTEEITIYALCGNTSYQNICFSKEKIHQIIELKLHARLFKTTSYVCIESVSFSGTKVIQNNLRIIANIKSGLI